MQQKHGLFWALGIVSAAMLSVLAWHQIRAGLAHFFPVF